MSAALKSEIVSDEEILKAFTERHINNFATTCRAMRNLLDGQLTSSQREWLENFVCFRAEEFPITCDALRRILER